MIGQLDLDRRPNTARFSPDEIYRYTLTRELGGDRLLASMGLNPSKATADIDDNTIRKDMGFARRWGCGRLFKLNAYGYRATDPDDMKRARKAGVDVIGLGGGIYPNGAIDPGNDAEIRNVLELVKLTRGLFVVSWGNHVEHARQIELASIFCDVDVPVWCLGTNKNGTPEHELYIPYERQLELWTCP